MKNLIDFVNWVASKDTKQGKLFGQFRRWAKQKGYIHPINENTSPDTSYEVPGGHIPLIFDFVMTGRPQRSVL